MQLASKEVELDDEWAGYVFHNDGVWYRVEAEMVNGGAKAMFCLGAYRLNTVVVVTAISLVKAFASKGLSTTMRAVCPLLGWLVRTHWTHLW